MIRMVVPVVLMTAGVALAAQLEIGKGIFTRSDSLPLVLKLTKPLGGPGELTLTWTDCYGRTVAVDKKAVQVDGDTLATHMKLDRAVAMQNVLKAELNVGRTTVSAPKTEFIVTPESARWDDYQIIMYYAYKTPAQQWALRDVGITAGKIPDQGQAIQFDPKILKGEAWREIYQLRDVPLVGLLLGHCGRHDQAKQQSG